MFHYVRPKSQLWGHKLMRFSSTELLTRATRFLREHTIVERDTGAYVSISWDPRRTPDFATSVDAIRHRIAGAPQCSEGRGFEGEVLPNLTWTLPAHEMAVVAKWLDEVCGRKAPEGVSAVCTYSVAFRWAGAAFEANRSENHDGTFGIHFGGIRALTTRFSFATLNQYLDLKRYLSEIGLVELSDKSLHSS